MCTCSVAVTLWGADRWTWSAPDFSVVRICVCVRACVRARVCVRVYVCVRACAWVRTWAREIPQSIKSQVYTWTAGFMPPTLNFVRPSFVGELLQQKFRGEVSSTLNRKRIPARVEQLVTRGAALGGWRVVEGKQNYSPWARRND